MHWGIIGTGGHSKVVLEAITSYNEKHFFTFFSKSKPINSFFTSFSCLLDQDHIIQQYKNTINAWHVAIGDISSRKRKFEQLKQSGLLTPQVTHKNSIISPSVTVGEGTLINSGSIIIPSWF